jgi:hypothetical protein
MVKKSVYTKFMTPKFRISYPHLIEPQLGPDGTGTPKYGLKMMFPKEGMDQEDKLLFQKLREGSKKAAIDYWGDPLPKNLKKPLKDGDADSDREEDKGFWYASARSKDKPGVVSAQCLKIIDPDEIKNMIYPGCWCRATIAVGATEQGGSKCVHFILNNIQFVKDDTRLDGRTSADRDFEPVSFAEDSSGDGF